MRGRAVVCFQRRRCAVTFRLSAGPLSLRGMPAFHLPPGCSDPARTRLVPHLHYAGALSGFPEASRGRWPLVPTICVPSRILCAPQGRISTPTHCAGDKPMVYFIVDAWLGITFQVDSETVCRILESAYTNMTCIVRRDV